jgi:hypothetical protein
MAPGSVNGSGPFTLFDANISLELPPTKVPLIAYFNKKHFIHSYYICFTMITDKKDGGFRRNNSYNVI